MRFWFFGGGGTTFIATSECRSLESAKRLVADYNRQPGPLGPIDLIADAKVPGEATQSVSVDAEPSPKTGRDDAEG